MRRLGGLAFAVMPSARLGATPCAPSPNQSRFQATGADKKFHCSICKKGFRLEMAAKLHVEQVHSGKATIETGAGPGQQDAAPPPPSNAPPTAPTARPMAMPLPREPNYGASGGGNNFNGSGSQEEDETRRKRPTPRPLHESMHEIPSTVMTEMLEVWDKVGSKRVEGFIHSSMVMKVYAAKPASEIPDFEPDVPDPTGINPFTDITSESVARAIKFSALHYSKENVPMAVANGITNSAYRTAGCINPFLVTLTVARKDADALEEAEPTEAPVTPYGQLGKFGTLPPPSATPTPAATTTPEPSTPTNPFAAAAEAANPFASAAQASNPFASAAQAANPFAAAAATAPNPFGGASSFSTEAAKPATPDVAAPSSPFGAPTGASSFADLQQAPEAASPVAAAPQEVEKKFSCPVCSKCFKSEFSLSMHSKQRHNLDLAISSKEKKAKRKVPDLPAYIPSPVDLTATSVFGREPNQPAARWSEVELIPNVIAATNTTLVGLVREVLAHGGVTYIATAVTDVQSGDEDVIVLACDSQIPSLGDLAVGDEVCAIGTLRLHPTLDESVSKYFACPMVHITRASGTITAL